MSTININLNGVVGSVNGVTPDVSGNVNVDTIYNADGTITNLVRTVDLDGNILTFVGGKLVHQGSGNTSSDIQAVVENGDGLQVQEWLGDRSSKFYGRISTGADNASYKVSFQDGTLNGLYVSGNGTGARIIGTSVGVQGEGSNGVSGIGVANGVVGTGLTGGRFSSSTSEAANVRAVVGLGGGYFESFGVNGTPQESAILESNSTTKANLGTRHTTAEKNAISSPANYLETNDTDLQRKDFYHPFWGWHPIGNITPDWGFENYEKIIPGQSGAFAIYQSANGGLAGGAITNSALSPQRLRGLSTGTSTNGEYRRNSSKVILGGVSKKQYKTAVSVDALSDATNRYVALLGFQGYETAGLGLSAGYGFVYDEGGVYATATASPNWLCVTLGASGVYTVVDSGVAVTTTASGALQRLEILDDGTGNSLQFYINGTLVATIITNLPISTQTYAVCEKIVKQAGTTARNLYVDYSYYKEKFNTPR